MKKIAAALFITMALITYSDIKSDVETKLKEAKIEREIVSKGIPLSEVVSILQKATVIKIDYTDMAAGVIVALDIKNGAKIFDILKELEKNYGITYIVEKEKITLNIKIKESNKSDIKTKESKYLKKEAVKSAESIALPAPMAADREEKGRVGKLKDAEWPVMEKEEGKSLTMASSSRNQTNSLLKAGEHDDNEEFKYYLEFMKKAIGKEEFDKELKYLESMNIVGIYDKEGNPVMGAEITVDGRVYKSYPDGEALIYINKPKEKISVKYKEEKKEFEIDTTVDKRVQLKLNGKREAAQTKKLDIVFVMDTTGSMGDEIDILRDTIYSIYTRIKNMAVKDIDVNFGMVLYRDSGDDYMTSKFDLTGNIDEFQKFLFTVKAGGGGDYPEQLVLGFRKSVDGMSWRDNSMRMVFAVTDAPDHAVDMEALKPLCSDAVAKNIKMFGIGASGLDISGEKQLRFISQQTKGKFIFMTYGEKNDSDARGEAGDSGKVSHHTGSNFNSRNLDDIIVENVKKEIYNQIEGKILEESRNSYDYKGDTDKIDARIENIIGQIRKQLYITKKISPETTTLVLPIETSDKVLNEMGKYMENGIMKRMADENFIKMVDRSKLAVIYEEIKLKIASVVKGEIKGLTGADTIMVSSLSFIGDNEVLFIKIIDTTTSEVVAAAMVKI